MDAKDLQTTPWVSRDYHRRWLANEAEELFSFFQPAAFNPAGGFFDLDSAGEPREVRNVLREIHATTRMVHCFSIASLLGRPGADTVVDHGMRYLWEHHRDQTHGGYHWSLNNDGPVDDNKQAYGHAFVLLAASSAKLVGHPLADSVIADITQILNSRFWDEAVGASREEFARDWSEISTYRGQNSNMHLTEALMAAFEATGESDYLTKAERIAQHIIGVHARAQGFRVAEHFDTNWVLDKDYSNGDVFRPAGSTPGHWMEWSRLLLQLYVLGGKRLAWLPEAADALFRQGVELGWDKELGGLYYTLNWDNSPRLEHKLWWPICEAIGAAAWLNALRPDPFYESWYRRFWDYAANHLLDVEHGGWHPELSREGRPASKLFTGKPDIYHALQACLIPLFPPTGSVTRGIIERGGKLD